MTSQVSSPAANATTTVGRLMRTGVYGKLEASAFFTAAHFEIDQRDKSPLSQQQRDGLLPLLSPRDELITLLARSDPAAADKLSNLYVSVRKVLGL